MCARFGVVWLRVRATKRVCIVLVLRGVWCAGVGVDAGRSLSLRSTSVEAYGWPVCLSGNIPRRSSEIRGVPPKVRETRSAGALEQRSRNSLKFTAKCLWRVSNLCDIILCEMIDLTHFNRISTGGDEIMDISGFQSTQEAPKESSTEGTIAWWLGLGPLLGSSSAWDGRLEALVEKSLTTMLILTLCD